MFSSRRRHTRCSGVRGLGNVYNRQEYEHAYATFGLAQAVDTAGPLGPVDDRLRLDLIVTRASIRRCQDEFQNVMDAFHFSRLHEEAELAAVPYTHLTLPTNREV